MGWTKVGTIPGTATGGGGGGGGTPGPKGQDGTKVLVGSTAPTLLLGNVGDLYFQTPPPGATGPILIPGPQGNPGRQGVPGPPGISIGSNANAGMASFFPSQVSTWTTVFQSGATLVANGSALVLSAPAINADSDFSMCLKSLPATPFSCIFFLRIGLPVVSDAANHSNAGVLFRNSSNHNVSTLDFISINGAVADIEKGFSADGVSHVQTDQLAIPPTVPYYWFKLTDDGVNQTYSLSADGIIWNQVWSEARNTHVTADQVGWFVNPRNASSLSAGVSLWSYQETSP